MESFPFPLKQTGLKVIKLFPCSTQLSLIFVLLINSKLPISTVVFMLSLAQGEIFYAEEYENADSSSYLSAENISCSAELSTKRVLESQVQDARKAVSLCNKAKIQKVYHKPYVEWRCTESATFYQCHQAMLENELKSLITFVFSIVKIFAGITFVFSIVKRFAGIRWRESYFF